MFQILNHKEINKTKWDQCIENSSLNIVYAKSWFLDTVSPKWNAIVYKDYEAVMPLTCKKKLTFSYLYQPHFCQQLGVFHHAIEENLTNEFLNHIPKKYQFIEINLNKSNRFSSKEFSQIENKNYELNISADYDTIYSGYSENTKRNIKKAQYYKSALLENSISLSEVVFLFKKSKGDTLKLEEDYYQTLFSIQNAGKEKTKIFTVKDTSTKTVAAAFLIIENNRLIFLFSANTETGKQMGAMHFLIDSVIKQYAGKPYILDFEGSNNLNLARFYSSFGSEETVYLRVRRNSLPKIVKWLKS